MVSPAVKRRCWDPLLGAVMCEGLHAADTPWGSVSRGYSQGVLSFNAERIVIEYTLLLLRPKLNRARFLPMEFTASKDTCIASKSNDSVCSEGRGAQRVGRSRVCRGDQQNFQGGGDSAARSAGGRRGLWRTRSPRQREQHEHKYGGLKLQGPRGEVMLDHGREDLPTPWLSHCV